MNLTELLSPEEWGRFEREIHDRFGVSAAEVETLARFLAEWIGGLTDSADGRAMEHRGG